MLCILNIEIWKFWKCEITIQYLLVNKNFVILKKSNISQGNYYFQTFPPNKKFVGRFWSLKKHLFQTRKSATTCSSTPMSASNCQWILKEKKFFQLFYNLFFVLNFDFQSMTELLKYFNRNLIFYVQTFNRFKNTLRHDSFIETVLLNLLFFNTNT